MRKTRLLLALLCAWVGLVPLAAQSVRVTQELTLHPFATVLPMYKNEFGSFEKPALDITFPFAVIRMQLEGNARDVMLAKQRLTLYMGQMTGVESRCTTYSNQILFLVPARRPSILIDCGDGCDRVLLIENQKLEPNRIYDCSVHFIPEREGNVITDTVFVNQGPQLHKLRLRVEPADAKIEVIAHGEEKKWILRDGVVTLQLAEGDYQYTITADDYYTATGVIRIPTNQTDTTIRLRPTFGWLSICSDSTDLRGLSASISHEGKTEMKPLPFGKAVYNPGGYAISIKKEKHYPYYTTITIEGDKVTTLCPVLVPKAYKRNTFLLAEAGFTTNLSWGVGLMIGQVYGEVRKKCGAGWYIQGRSNFQSTKAKTRLLIDYGGYINGEKPYYTGQERTKEFMINTGLVLNFLNMQKPNRSNNSMFGIYAGLGYGLYAHSWEDTDGDWYEYAPTKAQGISFGGGFLGSIKGFTINAGINTIQAKYVEMEIGLGWTF